MKTNEVVLVVLNSVDSNITKLVAKLAVDEIGKLEQFDDGIEIETLTDSAWNETKSLFALAEQRPSEDERQLEREDDGGENARYLGLPGLSFGTTITAIRKADELNLQIVSEYRGCYK